MISLTSEKKSKNKKKEKSFEVSEPEETYQKSSKKKRKSDVDESEVELPKKKKKMKLIPEIVHVSDEGEDQNQNLIENEKYINPKNNTKVETEVSTWTTEDYVELIRRMESQTPKNDTISFSSRVKRLNWEEIKFKSYSKEECFEKWNLMKGRVRHFRLLREMLQDCKTWTEKPWLAYNKKKNRHPEQPIRPLTSFMLFYMAKKDKTIKRNPGLKLTEISKLIGMKYKALPEEKKAYYKEKAKETQEEYRENLLKFYEKYPELIRESKKQVKTNKPQPPVKLYLQDKLQKHKNDENFDRQAFTEKYKEMWKNLSNKKKAYWIRLAKEEEEKYLEHLQEDLLHDGDKLDGEVKPIPAHKSVISKEENAILDKLAGKPEKPPNSAYSLFSRLKLKEANLMELGPKNRMKEIANLWKEVPEEQKKAYAEDVQQMHETYKLEFASYLESLPQDKRAEEMAKLLPKKRPVKFRQKTLKKNSACPISLRETLFKNEPEKPPVTAWDLFKTEYVKQNCHVPSKLAFKQAADQWKRLPKKETERYRKKHEQLKEKYIHDFEAFLKTLDEHELKEYSAMKTGSAALFDEVSIGDDSSSEEDQSSGSSSSCSDSGVSEEDS